MSTPTQQPEAERVSWADPGYFDKQSRLRSAFRVVKHLFVRQRGHSTMPTRAGLMLCLLAIGVGTAAFNTASNILYLTLALLLSSLLLSGLMSWMNFAGTRWGLKVEPHMRAREVSPVRLEIHNEKKRLPTYALWFNLEAEQSETETTLPLGGRLEPGKSIELEWMHEPKKRGKETILLRGLISQFPFGFLRKKIGDSLREEAIVWPERIEYTFRAGGYAQSKRGESRTVKRGYGTELLNLRPYQYGDGIRQVHWKASARSNTLLVRETAEEDQTAFTVHVDTTEGIWQDGAQFEKLCAFAATLAEDLYMRGCLRAASLNDEPVIMMKRLSDLHAFLSLLATVKPESHTRRELGYARGTEITFQPGSGSTVFAYVDGVQAGSA